jgi:uncharacterized protein (UPF0332 family)
LSEDNKRRNIASEWREAESRLQTARRWAADPGTRKDAVTRAYYAAFHAVRAVLLTRGLEPKTHRGVRETFRAQFTADGALPEALATKLDHLEAARLGADYAAGREFSAEEAERLLADAEAIVAGARAVLAAGGWLG